MSQASLAAIVVAIVLLGMLLPLLVLKSPKANVSFEEVATSCRGDRSTCADVGLLVFRLSVAVYMLCINISCAVEEGPERAFNYFTIWSWSLLSVYFLLASSATALHLVSRRGEALREACRNDGRWRHRLARVNQIVFATASASALMLDITLWGVLLPTDTTPSHPDILNFCSYNQHAGNLLLIGLEMLANNIDVHFCDIFISMMWPVVYACWTLIRVGSNPKTRICLTEQRAECTDSGILVWPYFFMDTSHAFAVLWYLGLFAFFCLAYVPIVYLARCSGGRGAQAIPSENGHACSSHA